LPKTNLFFKGEKYVSHQRCYSFGILFKTTRVLHQVILKKSTETDAVRNQITGVIDAGKSIGVEICR